jgi:hypothetical protein
MRVSTWALTRSSSRWRTGRISRGLRCGAGAQRAGGEAGADHVDPVQCGLLGDLLLITPPGQALIGDLGDEVLGDLLLVDHLGHG